MTQYQHDVLQQRTLQEQTQKEVGEETRNLEHQMKEARIGVGGSPNIVIALYYDQFKGMQPGCAISPWFFIVSSSISSFIIFFYFLL